MSDEKKDGGGEYRFLHVYEYDEGAALSQAPIAKVELNGSWYDVSNADYRELIEIQRMIGKPPIGERGWLFWSDGFRESPEAFLKAVWMALRGPVKWERDEAGKWAARPAGEKWAIEEDDILPLGALYHVRLSEAVRAFLFQGYRRDFVPIVDQVLAQVAASRSSQTAASRSPQDRSPDSSPEASTPNTSEVSRQTSLARGAELARHLATDSRASSAS